MRVNSTFTGFFTNWLVVKPGFSIVMLATFFIASSFTEHSYHNLRSKQGNLIIRQIGHRLLLQAGDSTSRVLPVTEVSEGTFLLKFENEFIFNHDSLMVLSQRLLPKAKFPSGYTVTVHDCVKGAIVYGFQVNNTSPDILACSGRSQPQGCYTIEFAFPDFYKNVEQKKSDVARLTEPVKADPQEVDSALGEIKPTTFDYDIHRHTGEPNSGKVASQEVNPKPEAFKTTAFNSTLTKVVYGGMFVLLGIALVIRRFGKVVKPVPVQLLNHAVIKDSVPEFATIGKFLFDVKDQRLLLGSEVIALTEKEFKVLELLHRNFGEMIARETLMQEVWINEGVITGRSLDMFISKLRKKLSVDPGLRITNIHGKGYRLETVNNTIA